MTSKSPVLEVCFHEVKQRCEKNFVKKAMKTVKQHSQPNIDRHCSNLLGFAWVRLESK